ncbi:MAG: Gfo/Idh/MocA family oxidoreductase [Deltaproteobacteria bacterium]|nr:MAG: Gfo/Idh/MocA family oxidoreductase [Deltaproteobacteria bacterium]
MRRVGVGLVGAGKHGQRYLAHLRADVPELVLAAFCRRDASRGRDEAARLGCRFHADWRALVADPAVEAVIVVVPPVLHPAIAEAVAAAGKPLLIEKPLATTGAAAVEVVRVLRTARVPCLMAQTLRWNAVVRAIRARLPEIGALHAVVLNQRFEPSPLVWLDDPSMSGGGILLHTGVHSFATISSASRMRCEAWSARPCRSASPSRRCARCSAPSPGWSSTASRRRPRPRTGRGRCSSPRPATARRRAERLSRSAGRTADRARGAHRGDTPPESGPQTPTAGRGGRRTLGLQPPAAPLRRAVPPPKD